VVQVGRRCREVKRDQTAGLAGCSVESPPKAAPSSRRVWPHASIALDRGHGSWMPGCLALVGMVATSAADGRCGGSEPPGRWLQWLICAGGVVVSIADRDRAEAVSRLPGRLPVTAA
jgi:hypothetical protein